MTYMVNFNGVELYTKDETLHLVYNKYASDAEILMSGRSNFYRKALEIVGIEGDFVLVDDTQYTAFIAELNELYVHSIIIPDLLLYLRAGVESVSMTLDPSGAGFSIRCLQVSQLRIIDAWKFNNGGALIKNTNTPSQATYLYHTLNPIRLIPTVGSGLVITGAGAWDTAIREHWEKTAIGDVVWGEIIVNVPVASRASVGLVTLSSTLSQNNKTGTAGLALEFRSGDAILVDGTGTTVKTLIRIGGVYRINVSMSYGVARMVVWQNGLTWLHIKDVNVVAMSGIVGLFANVFSGTMTLERWWAGVIA